MQLFFVSYLAGFFLICAAQPGRGQDLGNLFPVAHYSLINTDQDLLGHLEPIELEHAPFEGADGVYSNGLYIGDNPDNGSYILTPPVPSLYDSVFAVRIEYEFTDLDGELRPVIVLGPSYRYLGWMVWPDNTYYVLLNNGDYISVPGLTAEENVFHELTLIHHLMPGVTEFYLDQNLVMVVPGVLDRNQMDGFVLNTNPGMGRTFKGHWRNVRIYGASEVTALRDNLQRKESVYLYPNPVIDELRIRHGFPGQCFCHLNDLTGHRVLSTWVAPFEGEVDVSMLPEGIYQVCLQSDLKQTYFTGRFVKVK